MPQQDPNAPPESIILGQFSGLRNTVEYERLKADELVTAVNVDIDDAGQIRRRRGYSLKAAGVWHSIKTLDGKVYGVKDGMLGIIRPDYNFTVLYGVGTSTVCYTEVNGEVYFSGKTTSGVITADEQVIPWGNTSGQGTWYSPVYSPTDTLGEVGGSLLGDPVHATCVEAYKGRIYLAAGNTLWATELFRYHYVDRTKNFMQFEHEITLVMGVDDGLYVGTAGALYFLQGVFGSFKMTRVADDAVVRGSGQSVPVELVHPQARTQPVPVGTAAVFLTARGIVAGFDSGNSYNLTHDTVRLPTGLTAASLFREDLGANHFITSIDSGGAPTINTAAIADSSVAASSGPNQALAVTDRMDAEIRRAYVGVPVPVGSPPPPPTTGGGGTPSTGTVGPIAVINFISFGVQEQLAGTLTIQREVDETFGSHDAIAVSLISVTIPQAAANSPVYMNDVLSVQQTPGATIVEGPNMKDSLTVQSFFRYPVAERIGVHEAFTANVISAVPTANYVMPDAPIAPTGPFIAKGQQNLDSGSLTLSKVSYSNDYISIDHSNTATAVDLISITDATTDNVGSIYYTGAGANTTEANFTRIRGTAVRTGRPFIRLVGSGDTAILTDIYCDYDPTPNIHTGDIATGVQCGRHPADGHWKKLIIRRMLVTNIATNWPAGSYWNGDGVTAERNLDLLDIQHLYCKVITDGAVDSKARTNLVSYLYAENMRQALKLWDDSTCDHIISINPVVPGTSNGSCSHVRLMGAAPSGNGLSNRVPLHNMTNMYCTGNAVLVHLENGPVEFHGSGHYEGPLTAKGMPAHVNANGGSLTANSTWNGSLLV